MKAIVLDGINEPARLKNVDDIHASAGEVVIQLRAAALNHRDVWIQQGQYAGLRYPITVGSDGAGVVTDVGKDVDTNWLNQEVIINPGHAWGDNPAAQSKDFKILGLPENGTLAEYVRVRAKYVHPRPAHLTFEEAAALPLAGLTAYRALITRASVQRGERVLITGIGGGVALFALQFALVQGATAFVTSGSDHKIAQAMALGASGGANYKNADWVETLRQQAGGDFHVIIDSAAGDGFAHLVALAAPGGRIALYGGTQGKIPELAPQRIFWKQLSILGSTMGTNEEFRRMLALIEANQLKPVIDQVFPLADAESAFRRMDNRQQFGKIVLRIS